MEPPAEAAWYVAYGSNICRERLLTYLEGAVAPDRSAGGGADAVGSRAARYGAHRGCVDPSPPTDERWLHLGHPVAFRGRSRRWGGGVAFLGLRAEAGVRTEVRAWRVTTTQVLAIAGQEAGLPADPGHEVLAPLVAPGATSAIGGGWYDTLLRLPDVEGRPALTVTTAQDLPLTDPTPAYLATIAAGRAEHPGRGAQPCDGGGAVGGSAP